VFADLSHNCLNSLQVKVNGLESVVVAEVINAAAHAFEAIGVVIVIGDSDCSATKYQRAALIVVSLSVARVLAVARLHMLEERRYNDQQPQFLTKFSRVGTSTVAFGIAVAGSALAVAQEQDMLAPTIGDTAFAEASVSLAVGIGLLTLTTCIANIKFVAAHYATSTSREYAVGTFAGFGAAACMHAMHTLMWLAFVLNGKDAANLRATDLKVAMVVSGVFVFFAAPLTFTLNDV